MPFTDAAAEEELIATVANRDSDAIAFLTHISHIARLADDLADGDSDSGTRDASYLLWKTTHCLNSNVFFRQNSSYLLPVINNATLMWEVSEEWKRSPVDKTRLFGFVYREMVMTVFYAVAILVGGYEHAREMVRLIHDTCVVTSDETLNEWEQS